MRQQNVYTPKIKLGYAYQLNKKIGEINKNFKHMHCMIILLRYYDNEWVREWWICTLFKLILQCKSIIKLFSKRWWVVILNLDGTVPKIFDYNSAKLTCKKSGYEHQKGTFKCKNEVCTSVCLPPEIILWSMARLGSCLSCIKSIPGRSVWWPAQPNGRLWFFRQPDPQGRCRPWIQPYLTERSRCVLGCPGMGVPGRPDQVQHQQSSCGRRHPMTETVKFFLLKFLQ